MSNIIKQNAKTSETIQAENLFLSKVNFYNGRTKVRSFTQIHTYISSRCEHIPIETVCSIIIIALFAVVPLHWTQMECSVDQRVH